MNISEYLKQQKVLVDQALLDAIERQPQRKRDTSWHRAMEYSLFSGGKRLRPILVLAASQCFLPHDEAALALGCALEMIHTYSLIHDDLPALDNDTLRRGRPTCHTVFGVDGATLAGLTLLNCSYLIFRETADRFPQRSRIIRDTGAMILRAAGIEGMVGGQTADLLAEGKNVPLEEVIYIHKNKTAAMIKVSVLTGCILACSVPEIIDKFSCFGEKIGLAFQIVDDILDILSNTEKLGKNARSDIERGKATYPARVGIEKAKHDADKLVREAIDLITDIDLPVEPLTGIARYLISREM